MAMPPMIGALPPVPSAAAGAPSGMGQMLSAIGQMPQMIEQQQAQQLQVEEQKSKVGQQLLSQIGSMVAGDPTKAGDPQLINRVMHISKMTGVPPPIKDGKLDLDILNPAPDFATLTPQEKIQGLALPTNQRSALYGKYRNVDPAYLSADQVVPPSAGSVTAMYKNLTTQVDAMAAGTLDPVKFAASIRGMAGPLKAAGVDTTQYLTEDFLSSGISKYADAQIARLRSLGIHIKDEDAYKNRLLTEKQREFGQTMGFHWAGLQERTAEDAKREARGNAHLALEQQRFAESTALATRHLNDYERNLDSLIANRGTKGPNGTAAVQKSYSLLQRSYDDAQREYDGAIKAINTATAQNQTPDQRLLDLVDPAKPDSLKAKMDAIGIRLKAYEPLLKSATDTALSAGLGHNVRAVGGFDASKATRTGKLNGQTVYQMPDGHVYDGSGKRVPGQP